MNKAKPAKLKNNFVISAISKSSFFLVLNLCYELEHVKCVKSECIKAINGFPVKIIFL